ncbi:MAG: hypothetical protein ACXABY_20095, partial [Candidatus Thorarchaeota archaeon]
LQTIAKAVVSSYQEDPDIKVIEDFVLAVNKIKTLGTYSIGTVFEQLEKIAGPDTIDTVMKIQDPGREPLKAMSYLKFEHIDDMLKRWNVRWTSSLTWQCLLDRLSFSQLKELLQGELKTAFEKNYDNDWPANLQDILWSIFIRVPDHEMEWWNEYLDEFNLGIIYNGETLEKYASKSMVRDRESYSHLALNELICRCGFASTRQSGLSFHQRRSDEDECCKVGLRTAAKIVLASIKPGTLVCTGCGKTLKSKPGFTLHRKKCEGKLLETIADERDFELARDRGRESAST